MRVSIRLWAVAGLVVGVMAAAGLVIAGALDHEAAPARSPLTVAERRAQDATSFLAAWERSRLATFVVTSSFRRTLTAGGGFTGDVVTAQRPPDRLERRNGAVSGRLGNRIVRCGTTAAGVYGCDSSPAGGSYRRSVERDVAILRSYLDGPLPLYVVEADVVDDGCFDLTQRRPLPAPPYGTAARFCFDPSTGAPTYTEVRRAEATDVTEATRVRAEARDADLRPPADGEANPDPTPGSGRSQKNRHSP